MSIFFMAGIPQTEVTADLSATDFTCPPRAIGLRVDGSGGTVQIRTRSGDLRTRTLVAGGEWVIAHSSVVRAGTTATNISVMVG